MKKWVFFIIVLGIFLGYNYLFHEDKVYMKQIEEKVENYLINEKGYSKDDIKELQARHHPKFVGNPGEYDVRVIFTDSPDDDYAYFIVRNEVHQGDYSNSNGKHVERCDL